MDDPEDLEDRVVAALRREALIVPVMRRHWTGRVAAAALLIALLVAGPMLVRPGTAERPGNMYMLALYSGDAYVAAAPGVRASEYGRWARSRAQAVVEGAELTGRPALLGSATDPGSVLSGYFIVRASDDADALAIARTVPHLRHGGTVVVRRVGR